MPRCIAKWKRSGNILHSHLDFKKKDMLVCDRNFLERPQKKLLTVGCLWRKILGTGGLGEERRLVFHCIPFCVFWEKIFLNNVACIIFLIKKKVCVGEGKFKKNLQVLSGFSGTFFFPVSVARSWLTGLFSAPLSQPQPMPTPPPGSITTSHRYLKPTFSPGNTNNSNLERRLSFIALTEQTEISWLWDAR